MSIKTEARRLIDELPDGCTWMDVLRAIAAGAGGTLVAVTDSPEEMARLRGGLDAAAGPGADGWCVGPIPIPLGDPRHAPPLAEVMGRVRAVVEHFLGAAGVRPAEPDPREMN